jgi:hypothetical protein
MGSIQGLLHWLPFTTGCLWCWGRLIPSPFRSLCPCRITFYASRTENERLVHSLQIGRRTCSFEPSKKRSVGSPTNSRRMAQSPNQRPMAKTAPRMSAKGHPSIPPPKRPPLKAKTIHWIPNWYSWTGSILVLEIPTTVRGATPLLGLR